MRVIALSLVAVLAACAPYPRDIEGTLDRIEERRTIHVGLASMRRGDQATARDYVARLERAAGARAAIDSGPTELQLARLDQGALDVVLGDFAEDSPWIAEVTVVEPLVSRREGDRNIGLSPVAANGENRWIALLEREVRDARE